MNKKRYPDRFWSAFGKVSAVLVALAALIAIIAYVIPSKPRIWARATQSNYKVNPEVINAFSSAKDLESYDSLVKYLEDYFKKGLIQTDYLKGKTASNLALDLDKRYREPWGTKYYSLDEQTRMGEYYYEIAIGNKSGFSAKNALLVLPADGQYAISTNSGPMSTSAFTHQIPLGEIKPNVQISLSIWSTSQITYWFEKDCFVTFDDGVARVAFSIPAFGFYRFLVENGLPTLIAGGGVAIGIVLVLLLVRASSAQPATRNKGGTVKKR